jgi:hypothetical protein
MRLGATLLGVGPIVGVAMLSVGLASHHPTWEVCSYKPDRMILVAQQATKDRLPNLHFPIFSYSSDDHAYASNDQCNWTVIGHVETLADDGTLVRGQSPHQAWRHHRRANCGFSHRILTA